MNAVTVEFPYAIYDRFVQYYLRKLRATEAALKARQDDSFGAALSLFDEDLAQIRQAQAWLNACAPQDIQLSKAAIVYTGIDHRLLALRLGHDEMMAWFTTGLESARRLEDTPSVMRFLYRIVSVYNDTSRFDNSLPYLQELLKLSQAAQSRRDEAKAWLGFGNIAYHRGRQAEAQEAYEKGVALLRAIGDRSDVFGLLMVNLATTYSAQGQHERSLSLLQEPVAIFRQDRDFFQLCTALNNMGNEYMALEQYAEALVALEEGAQIARSIGHEDTLGFLLANLGLVRLWTGQIDEARVYLEESIAILRKLDDLFGVLMMSGFLLHASMNRDNLDSSYRQLCDLISQANQNKMMGTVIALLTAAAKWYFLAGEPIRCVELLDFVTPRPELDSEWLRFVTAIRLDVAAAYPDLSVPSTQNWSLDEVVSRFV